MVRWKKRINTWRTTLKRTSRKLGLLLMGIIHIFMYAYIYIYIHANIDTKQAYKHTYSYTTLIAKISTVWEVLCSGNMRWTYNLYNLSYFTNIYNKKETNSSALLYRRKDLSFGKNLGIDRRIGSLAYVRCY